MKNMQELRKSSGYTRDYYCKVMGITVDQLKNYESGKTEIPSTTMMMAEALAEGIPVHRFDDSFIRVFRLLPKGKDIETYYEHRSIRISQLSGEYLKIASSWLKCKENKEEVYKKYILFKKENPLAEGMFQAWDDRIPDGAFESVECL